jgi:hypothetical protein
MGDASFYETYDATVKEVENKTVLLQRNSAMSTHSILARKSEEGPPPYCRTGAESEGFSQPGSLVRSALLSDPLW